MKTQTGVLSFFLLLTFWCPNFLGAQNNYDSDKINEHTVKLNYLFPGIEYEGKIIEDFTLCFRAGFKFSGFLPSNSYENDLVIRPFGEIQIRRYYKIKETSNKGKTMNSNSGDYFGLRGLYNYSNSYLSGDRLGSYVLLVGPMYGLQRTFKNKLTWSFHVGVGGYLAGANLSAVPFLGISIGSLIYKKDQP